MTNVKTFFTQLLINTKNLKSKKFFEDLYDRYYEKGLSTSQREILTIEGINHKLSIPSEILSTYIRYHLSPNEKIINFTNHLANNSDPKFKKQLSQISIHYKKFGWLSIKQRETIYISSYKLKKTLPIEFKLLTSDVDECNYIEAINS